MLQALITATFSLSALLEESRPRVNIVIYTANLVKSYSDYIVLY